LNEAETNPLADARCVLVRVPNWVGDVVMATPLFGRLRAGLPDARLVACARPYVTRILADGPWFDEVLAVDDKGRGGLRRTVRAIRAQRPDAAVLLPNSWRALLAVRLAGVRRIYGYRRRGRQLLLTGGPRPERDADGTVVPQPMTTYYLGLARALGLPVAADSRPSLYVGEAVARRGDELLQRYGIGSDDEVIGINPGAKFGSSKCWPTAHFARLAELLTSANPGRRLLLFVGPGEEELAEAIVAESEAPLINTGPDRVDLELLKPLVRRCRVLVTNDTGPRHYAVALGVPAVVIMGPTDPRYTAANLDHTTVLRRELPCSPCHLKACPNAHECMTGITPAAVAAAVEDRLQEGVTS
jgi:heptosyltransferase-2